MKKRRILNAVMVLLIFVMIGGAVMYAGSLKGWFDKDSSESFAKANRSVGIASVVRNGVGFSLSEETVLRDGDSLSTSGMSSVNVDAAEVSIVLGAESGMEIKSASCDAFAADVAMGEAFIYIGEEGTIDFSVAGEKVELSEGVYHISAQTGALTVSVFSGEAVYTAKSSEAEMRTASVGSALGSASGSAYRAKAGEALSILSGEIEVVSLQITSLNEFTIENAKKAEGICFSVAELDKVIEDREEEKRIALEELAKHEAEILAQGGTEKATIPVIRPSGQSQSGAPSGQSQSGAPSGQSQSSAPSLYCTIRIVCYTILDNMGNLTAGKDVFVPPSGVILATSRVEFTDGETVFDVLKRVCNYAGIQIEYSWTPMYNSYYIEGINHLYEFDCGPQSGWMYKVNGWFPNYGCSSYSLSDGDNIVWCYTCNGLGADVGGGVY